MLIYAMRNNIRRTEAFRRSTDTLARAATAVLTLTFSPCSSGIFFKHFSSLSSAVASATAAVSAAITTAAITIYVCCAVPSTTTTEPYYYIQTTNTHASTREENTLLLLLDKLLHLFSSAFLILRHTRAGKLAELSYAVKLR